MTVVKRASLSHITGNACTPVEFLNAPLQCFNAWGHDVSEHVFSMANQIPLDHIHYIQNKSLGVNFRNPLQSGYQHRFYWKSTLEM